MIQFDRGFCTFVIVPPKNVLMGRGAVLYAAPFPMPIPAPQAASLDSLTDG